MTEPEFRKRAVAIRYDPGVDAAPRVVAKGQGHVAQRIIELAREHEIPIHEDPDLVEVLAALELGELIPEEMYTALVEILAFLYQANKRAKTQLASA